MYNEEAQEPKLEVSMESEEDRLIKEQLIKEQMGVDDIELDGKLIQKILEAPKQA